MKKQIYALVASALIVTACGGGGKLNTSLIPVKSGGKYGYVDNKGQFVINPQFVEASAFLSDQALVAADGGFGYINTKGEYVINPMYKSATPFTDGMAWVVKEGGAPTAINEKGEELFVMKNAEIVFPYSGGLARFIVSDPNNERMILSGYVDKKGETVLAPTYYGYGRDFSEDLALVANAEWKHGYINKKGEMVINCQFKLADDFRDGKAVVCNDQDQWGVIDKTGKYIINPQFGSMMADGDNYMVQLGGGSEWGWCDKEGKIFINPQFDEAAPFNGNKLTPAGDKQGGVGYINKKGAFVINPQFEEALPFIGGTALVQSGGKWGLIDTDGKYVVNPQFDKVGEGFIEDPRAVSGWYATSDFFDTEAIVADLQKIISKEHIDGFIDFGTPLSRIISEYSLQDKAFSGYSQFQEVKRKALTKNAAVNIAVSGNFFERVSSLWFSNYELQKDRCPNVIRLTIYLQNKGQGKGELLGAEIVKLYGIQTGTTESVDYGKFQLDFNIQPGKIEIIAKPVAAQ